MILSSLLLVVLCIFDPISSAPQHQSTIVSGFDVEETLKAAQLQNDKDQKFKTVDSSPEVSGVVDGSTEDESKSNEEKSREEKSREETSELTATELTVTLHPGREHIHDPEHGVGGDVIFDEKHHVKKIIGGFEDGVEVGGNSQGRGLEPLEIDRGNHKFEKGMAPTEILWSSGAMQNGYNGGIRRPDYRRAYFFQRH